MAVLGRGRGGRKGAGCLVFSQVPHFSGTHSRINCHWQRQLKDKLIYFLSPKTVALRLPVASATAEWSFSSMRRIKTHLRASLSRDKLSSLPLIAVKRQLWSTHKRSRWRYWCFPESGFRETTTSFSIVTATLMNMYGWYLTTALVDVVI